MNLSQISKGMVIKNYKEFCRLLDEPILEGNSKVAQLRRWKRYLQFTHRKQHFRITKILDAPVKIEDGRAGRNISRRGGEIIDVFEPVLIRVIQNEGKDGELNIPKYSLYERLGIISKNIISFNYVYVVYGERGIEIKNRTGFNQDTVRINNREIPNIQELYFYEIVNDIARQIYYNSINKLARRGVLSNEKWREIIVCEKVIAVNNDDMEYITKVENDIFEKINIKNPNFIYYSLAKRDFYRKRNSITSDEKGWSGVYNILKVKFLDKDLLKNGKCCKKSVLTLPNKRNGSSDDFYAYRQKLNSIVCARVRERIEKEYNEFKENGVVKGKIGAAIKKKAFSDENFLDTQYFLIDNLLKI